MNDQRLVVGKPLVLLLGFVAVVSIIIAGLGYVDKQRKQEVYNQYATETAVYIANNTVGLEKIFNDVFVMYNCDNTLTQCRNPKGDTIVSIVSTDLKDWSSTLFLKLINSRLYSMGLSGDIHEVYSSNRQQDLEKLLSGQVAELPWGEYSYEFRGKEIVIPVKDSSGMIIGAIVRGVIE